MTGKLRALKPRRNGTMMPRFSSESNVKSAIDNSDEWSPLKKSELIVKSKRSPFGPNRRGVLFPLSVMLVAKSSTMIAVAKGKKKVSVRAAI